MLAIHIFLEGDEMLSKFPEDKVVDISGEMWMGALGNGMISGKPSVGIAFQLDDGRIALAQTSMRLFHTAAKAFAAKYGWQDEDGQSRSQS